MEVVKIPQGMCDRYKKLKSVNGTPAFTLIETLVAISLLAVAIVAPMSLTTQSLMGAYYARDQVTAFFLAQEAIEGVRSLRDANVLKTALGTPTDIMTNIPTAGTPFTVDAHTVPVTTTICPNGVCPPLQTDGELYGYNFTPAGSDTNFTRSVTAAFVGAGTDEIKVSVTVTWKTAAYKQNSFTLSANLYRWIYDSTAVSSVSNPPQVFTATGVYSVPVGVTSVSVLVVGGGGGGGWAVDRTGGGGGAGGFVYNSNYAVTAGETIPVTVGAGGLGGTNSSGAGIGGNSVFGTITAIGGGRGGTGPASGGVYASTGGSGGGGYHNPSDSGKVGTVGQGNSGGSGYDSGVIGQPFAAGGGGGAGSAGANGTVTGAGNGGAGIANSIIGTSVMYAGGGGGGGENIGGGTGGAGGGGNGATAGGAGSAGTANTGGGGGGGSTNGSGGAGGSGIVIVSPNQ